MWIVAPREPTDAGHTAGERVCIVWDHGGCRRLRHGRVIPDAGGSEAFGRVTVSTMPCVAPAYYINYLTILAEKLTPSRSPANLL